MHAIHNPMKRLAYWALCQSLRFCRAAGFTNPKGLMLDVMGDIEWH